MERIIPVFLILLSSISVLGQNLDCEQTLNRASAEFEAGHFYSLPGILKPCIDNGFSKEQKVRAYLLLTQTNLILNDQVAAEKSYLELLKIDPEYVLNPSRDPIDVYYLSRKFTTTARLIPNFRFGINTSLPRTIHSLSTFSNPANAPTSTQPIYKLGYQIAGGVDLNINENWSIHFGLGYSKKSFKSIDNNAYAGVKQTFTEKQDWLDIPLFVRYSKDSGTVRPFGYLGLAANILFKAKLAANETLADGKVLSEGPDVDITYKRNTFNRSVVLGGGIKYKVGKNFFVADIRYMAGLNNIAKNPYTKSSGQVDNTVFIYQYSSDFFRLDNLSFSIGFIKPLYDPRKKKSVVKNLFLRLGLKKEKR